MALFVAQGKPLRMGLQCKVPNETIVTFKRQDDTPAGPAMTLAASTFTPAGKGMYQSLYTWTGAGLADNEREAKIKMTNDKKDSISKPQEITVFRDRLVVKAVREDAPTVAVAGARCKVTVVSNEEWKAATRDAPAGYTKVRITGVDGTATFDDLPMGVITVEFLSSATFVAWVGGQVGETWTARVRQFSRFELVWPPELAPDPVTGAVPEPHRQWVNLNEAKARLANDAGAGPSYGSLAKVKVRVAGEAAAGQTVWLGVVFDPGNSTRTGLPRPALEGTQPAAAGEIVIKTKVVGDDGTATFDLELGAAGGDVVKIFVAGNAGLSATVFDASTSLITWRRLELRQTRMQVENNDALQAEIDAADSGVPDLAKTKVIAALKESFVEAKFPAPERTTVNAASIRVITGDLARALKLDPSRKSLLWVNALQTPDANLRISAAEFYPPRLYIIPIDKLVVKRNQGTWAFELDEEPALADGAGPGAQQDHKKVANIRSTIPLPNGGGFFLLRDWDGSALLDWRKDQPSYWQLAADDSPKIPITEEYIQVDRESSNLKCSLKVPASARPSVARAAKIFLRMNMYNGQSGSSKDHKIALVVGHPVPTDPRAPLKPHAIAYTLLHEIGHAMRLVMPAPTEYGYGPEADNPNCYVRGENDGNHCSYDLDATVRAKAPWDDDTSTVSGKCILYAPVSEKTPFDELGKYCPTCLKHLKAANFGQYNGRSDIGGFRGPPA